MHRIDSEGHVGNRFTEGNPQTGQQATILGAKWHNTIQEELADLVEFANIALSDADDTQVRQAIVALIAGVVGTGGGSVPTTRQVLGAGLLAGQGGPLAADLTFTLLAASAAEAAAQVLNDKVCTPASLAGLISLTVTGASWVLRLGPAVIQGFDTSIGANVQTIFTLPTSFTTGNLGAFVNGGRANFGAQDNTFVVGRGLSNVSVQNNEDVSIAINVVTFGY